MHANPDDFPPRLGWTPRVYPLAEDLVAGVRPMLLMLMGGSFSVFYDIHAVIVIGGGCLAGTMIRFPISTMIHGFPMGLRYAFVLRKFHPRELVEKITEIAEVVRRAYGGRLRIGIGVNSGLVVAGTISSAMRAGQPLRRICSAISTSCRGITASCSRAIRPAP